MEMADRFASRRYSLKKSCDRMIKQLLDDKVEQNIVICQWRAVQLFAEAEPLSLDKVIHPKFKIDTNSLNLNVHVCNQYCNQFVIILHI